MTQNIGMSGYLHKDHLLKEQQRGYPEHEKLQALGGANQIVGDFLEWLDENGYSICSDKARSNSPTYNFQPECKSRNQWISEHFGIDTDKLEGEKESMIAAFCGEKAGS